MILQLHALFTAFLTGLIWWVQLVHYPLFARVGAEAFTDFHRQHVRRATWVVAPAMILEAVTGVLLVWMRPADPFCWLGISLLAVIWGSTAWIQVPLHGRLEDGFDPRVHARLVRSNWLRTAAWSLRAVVVFHLLGAFN